MVLRILYVLLITLILPDAYLYLRLMYKRQRPLWARISFFVPNTILLITAFVLAHIESHTPENMKTMMFFFNFYMLVALPKSVFMLTDIVGAGLGLIWKKLRRPATILSTILSVTLFIILLTGMTFGPSHLKVRQADFSSHDLPASFDGYRIVQFTDLHLTSFRNKPEVVDKLVNTILAQKPDMIVFTGDLVSTDVDEMDGFEETLSRLWAPDGVYSVMGNHDYLTYARYLSHKEQAIHRHELMERQKQLGWNLLLNNHQVIHRGSDSIAVVGVENDGKPPFPERGDLKKALKDLPGYNQPEQSEPRMFKVLLSHDPTHWRRKVLPETDIQLTLSGHTHGMQFMIFGWSPSEFIYPEWRGMYTENDRSLHVSLGVGGALLPFRFGAWPEINVITLHRK